MPSWLLHCVTIHTAVLSTSSCIMLCAASVCSWLPVMLHMRFGPPSSSSGRNWIRAPDSCCIFFIISPPFPITTPIIDRGTAIWTQSHVHGLTHRHQCEESTPIVYAFHVDCLKHWLMDSWVPDGARLLVKVKSNISPFWGFWTIGWCSSPFHKPSTRCQLALQDHRYKATSSFGVPVYFPAIKSVPN